MMAEEARGGEDGGAWRGTEGLTFADLEANVGPVNGVGRGRRERHGGCFCSLLRCGWCLGRRLLKGWREGRREGAVGIRPEPEVEARQKFRATPEATSAWAFSVQPD